MGGIHGMEMEDGSDGWNPWSGLDLGASIYCKDHGGVIERPYLYGFMELT